MKALIMAATLLLPAAAVAQQSGFGAGFGGALPGAQAQAQEIERGRLCLEMARRGQYPPVCAAPIYVAPPPAYQAPQRCMTLPINRGAAGTAYVTRCE